MINNNLFWNFIIPTPHNTHSLSHSQYFFTKNHKMMHSRVSVLRGQVITSQGLGIVGVRVSVDRDARFGFTLTRPGGWWVWISSLCKHCAAKMFNYFLPLSLKIINIIMENPLRFDVLVNGGGAITLQFQRSPFRPMTRTVFVPWNQVNYCCHCYKFLHTHTYILLRWH